MLLRPQVLLNLVLFEITQSVNKNYGYYHMASVDNPTYIVFFLSHSIWVPGNMKF